MKSVLVSSLLASLMLTACATAPGSTPALEGTHWTLAAADKGELGKLAPASGITLGFAAGTLSGHGGCNQYRASYTLADGVLTAAPVGASKRLCPGDASTAEQAWFALLGAPLRVKGTADALELHGADGTVLRFSPAASPAAK